VFRLLVDTCVWLDLAKDPKQEPVLRAAEALIRAGNLSLIVPAIVLDEFRRNRDRIAKDSAKSLSSHFFDSSVMPSAGLGRTSEALARYSPILKT
jgi:hypothetical protein